MHSNVTIKNASWPHFSWPTLYNKRRPPSLICNTMLLDHPRSRVGGRARLTIRWGHTNVRRGPFPHTRTQDFLSRGALFFFKKVDDFFPNIRRKSCVDRLTSFRNMWIFHFRRLCLKMLFPAILGVLRLYPLNVVGYCRDPEKAHP